MKRYFTPTFYKFLIGFVSIVAVAFVAMATVALKAPGQATSVDNTAQAQ